MSFKSPRVFIRSALVVIGCGAFNACIGSELPTLDDVTLVLPGFDSLEVELHDRTGEVRADDGALLVRAGLTDWVAFQDTDGDEVPEAIAVVWSSGGGTGTFHELAVFDRARTRWRWRGSAALGDRVRVRVLALEGDRVSLHLTEHGPDDPACCPTVHTIRDFRVGPSGPNEIEP